MDIDLLEPTVTLAKTGDVSDYTFARLIGVVRDEHAMVREQPYAAVWTSTRTEPDLVGAIALVGVSKIMCDGQTVNMGVVEKVTFVSADAVEDMQAGRDTDD